MTTTVLKNQLTGEPLGSFELGPGANLSGADLIGANLSGADLIGANLSGADLTGANLTGADLYEANLYEANLRGANLSGANLTGANLTGADLYEANLTGADLIGANLMGADLYEANLYEANLRGANLSGANLTGANLTRANGIVSVSGLDDRGYTLVCWLTDGEPMFLAGCRSFSLSEALNYWGSGDYPDKNRGQRYLKAAHFLAEIVSAAARANGRKGGRPRKQAN